MPKEAIRGCLYPYGDDDPAESVAEVRWGRDGDYVQVVTRVVNPSTGEVYHDDEDKHRRAVDLSLEMHASPALRAGETLDTSTVSGRLREEFGLDPYRITPEERDWLLCHLAHLFGAGRTVRDGFYVDIDRRGINDMIRHLRRARDQAYGRDE